MSQQIVTMTGAVEIPDVLQATVVDRPWTPIVGADNMMDQAYQYETGHSYRIGNFVWGTAYVQLSQFGIVLQGNVLKLKGLPWKTAYRPGFPLEGNIVYISNQHPQSTYSAGTCFAGGGSNTALLVGWQTKGTGIVNPNFMTTDDPNDHSQYIIGFRYITDDPVDLPAGTVQYDAFHTFMSQQNEVWDAETFFRR